MRQDERQGNENHEYDAIIIGAGQSGGPLSQALAAAGQRVAIIERKHVGGTCVNEGCTPSKTMVASAEVAHLVRTASDYGVNTGNVSVDLKRVRLRKQEVVLSFRNASHTHIVETEGVDLYIGGGAFVAPYTVQVDLVGGGEEVLTAPKIFINTGGRPAWPKIDGLENVKALDSTSIMELERVPERLIVLGGGSTGLEFAQMFQRFGSEVTVVQRAPQLLRGEDVDIAEAVAGILREDGIDVLLNTSPVRVDGAGNGEVKMTVQGSDGEQDPDARASVARNRAHPQHGPAQPGSGRR